MAKRRMKEEENEMDLIPIMNMVLILIPLLLLSIVFMEISIINVSMAQKAVGPPTDPPDEPPKRLQIWASKDGFVILKNNNGLPPIAECQDRAVKVTVCTKKGTFEKPIEQYDYRSLYNELLKIKQDPSGEWKDHKTLEIVAGADVTFDVLVKTMDVSRYQLLPPSGDRSAPKGMVIGTDDEFGEAILPRPEQEDEQGRTVTRPVDLFPSVVLGMPKG